MCLAHGDETDSNPEMQWCGHKDRGLQAYATTCWTGYYAINAKLFHSLPPISQTVIVAIVR